METYIFIIFQPILIGMYVQYQGVFVIMSYIGSPYDISPVQPWFYVEGHFFWGSLSWSGESPRNTYCPKEFRRFRWVDRFGRWKALERSYGHRQVAGGWMRLWWLNSPFPIFFFGGSRLLIYIYIYIYTVYMCMNKLRQASVLTCIVYCVCIYIYLFIYTY